MIEWSRAQLWGADDAARERRMRRWFTFVLVVTTLACTALESSYLAMSDVWYFVFVD
jgi:hypothetical protein